MDPKETIKLSGVASMVNSKTIVERILGEPLVRGTNSSSKMALIVEILGAGPGTGAKGSLRCVAPRVLQLREEECTDLHSREARHENEMIQKMRVLKNWDHLTLVDKIASWKLVSYNNCAGLRLSSTMSSAKRRSIGARRSWMLILRPSKLGVKELIIESIYPLPYIGVDCIIQRETSSSSNDEDRDQIIINDVSLINKAKLKGIRVGGKPANGTKRVFFSGGIVLPLITKSLSADIEHIGNSIRDTSSSIDDGIEASNTQQ
ncbi:uncharacterized protein LOC115629832 [Scaptodrosophila lebanonensis]|uniref:Uncharacterized protein LOC115629832 n=1 Tax=Drosophila lebanonensis TaxID=7225 RepID=A0A6J2U1N1_DROLE|nr:uncharacterized protein LOC115629832 [Scaptodrosophila lebanonensis]